jgi:hypothetical protein
VSVCCSQLYETAHVVAPAGASLAVFAGIQRLELLPGSAGKVICGVRRLYQGLKPYHAGVLVVKAPSGALVISGVDPKSTM